MYAYGRVPTYPATTVSDGVGTAVSFIILGIFLLLGVLVIWRELRKIKKDWDDDQWRMWWDLDVLPDEPRGPGGLDLPKTEERVMVEAVGSKGSGA